jgi:hypothetical protein
MDRGKFKVAAYRAGAADARERARYSHSPQERARFLEMARTREVLADIFERRSREQPPQMDAQSK